MRTFFWFLGLLAAAFAAMALFAYPAWLLLHPHFDFPFHRIAARVGMLALLIGFVSVARRLGLADRASLGYGIARTVFLRELLRALAEIKAAGYATSSRTRRLVDEISLSVPVLLHDRALASLTVRFAASAVPLKNGIERFLPKLRQCAARISTGSFASDAVNAWAVP